MASISGPTSISVESSFPLKYVATGFSDPDSVTWTEGGDGRCYGSSDGNVFTMTGVSNYTSTITLKATQGGTSASISIKVTEKTINVTSFSPASSSVTLYEGNYTTVKYSYSPSNATNGTVPSSVSGGGSVATASVSAGFVDITAKSVGSTTLTFSNSNGVSFSISVTVKASSVDPTVYVTSMTVSPTTLSLSPGGSGIITATVYPSNADDLTVYLSGTSSSYSTSISRSGAVSRITVSVGNSFSGGKSFNISARGAKFGNSVSKTVYLELYKAPVYVTSVDWAGGFDPRITVGKSTTTGVVANPNKADDKSLSISVIEGDDIISISSSESGSSGYRVVITALKVGTAVIRASAQDGSGVYSDLEITVLEDSKFVQDIDVLGAGTEISIEDTDIYVRGYRRYTLLAIGMPSTAELRTISSCKKTSGSANITVTYFGKVMSSGTRDAFYLDTKDRGTAVITFTADDEEHFSKDYTVRVGDPYADYDYDKTTRITGYVGEEFGTRNVIINNGIYRTDGNYKVHSGCVGSFSVPGCYFEADAGVSTSVIPPVDNPWVISGTFKNPRIKGTPTEAGIWYLYTENSDGEILRVTIEIEIRGTFKKTLKFDANLPKGKTLKGTIPATMVAEYTGETYVFTIPESDISVDGYIFVGWREFNDNTTCDVYDPLDDFVVRGEDVDDILYAEWFPIPEGATGKGTENDPFLWTVKAEKIDLTVPNVGDYLIRYRFRTPDTLPAGVKFNVNGKTYPPQATLSLTEGVLKIQGTATSGVRKYLFDQQGLRVYQIWFALTILHEDMPDGDDDDGRMFTVTFDGNGGSPDLAECSERYGRSIVLPGASRDGYELDGWFTASTGGKSVGLSGERYVVASTVTLYAHWSLQSGTSAICYLRSSHNGVKGRMDMPIVESISDTVTSSLTTLPTIIYGVENTYVIDLGNSRKFSVNISRVVPPDYSDTSTDPADWSNGKWLKEFFRFIDFWQNFGRDVDTGRNTGGMRFHYEPTSDMKDMFPVIDKNVFVSGQISVSYPSPHRMRLNVPLQVASMDIQSSGTPTEKVTYSSTVSGMQPFTEYFVKGGLVTIANTPQGWFRYTKGQVMLRWSGSDGNLYYPGDVARLRSGVVLTAVWGNPVTQVFESDGSFEIPNGATRVLIYLVGGGGAGASCMASFWMGGAGGAGRTKSISMGVRSGQYLSWTIGKGGTPNAVSTTASNFQTDGGDGSESVVYLDDFKILSAEGGKGGRKFASGFRWSGTATGFGGNGWGSGGSTHIPTEDDIADDPYSTSNTKGDDGEVEAPNTSDNVGKGQYGGYTTETTYNEKEAYVGGAGGGASGLNVSTVYGTYASKGGDGGYLGSSDKDRIAPGDGRYGGGGGSGPGGRGGNHLGGKGGDGLIVFFVY